MWIKQGMLNDSNVIIIPMKRCPSFQIESNSVFKLHTSNYCQMYGINLCIIILGIYFKLINICVEMHGRILSCIVVVVLTEM